MCHYIYHAGENLSDCWVLSFLCCSSYLLILYISKLELLDCNLFENIGNLMCLCVCVFTVKADTGINWQQQESSEVSGSQISHRQCLISEENR